MIKYLLIALVTVFAMLGLAEFFHGIRLYCLSPDKKTVTYSVIFLDNSCFEQQLIYASEQISWFGESYADRIIAVNSDISDENIRKCSSVAERNNIICCEKENVGECISEIYNEKENN